MAGQSTTRFWIALIAAYVLVLNAGIGAYASSAGHDPSSLDAFGNPLCLAEHAIDADGEGPSQHDTAACCALACAAPAGLVLPDTNQTEPVSYADARPSPGAPSAHHRAGTGRYDPGRPRAPPALFR